MPRFSQATWRRREPGRRRSTWAVEIAAGNDPDHHYKADHGSVRIDDRTVIADGEVVASEIVDRRSILIAPRVDPIRQIPGVTVNCPSPDTASAG